MSEHRWSKFWWQDYADDDALRTVSLAAQGLWMRMLCSMHKGEPYGFMTMNGRAMTARQIAAVASSSEKEVVKLLKELGENGVYSVSDDGLLYSRRMVRDKAASDAGRENGKSGGNPTLRKPSTPPDNPRGKPEGLTPPVKLQEAEAEAEAKAEGEGESVASAPPLALVALDGVPVETKKAREPRAHRLPADWRPSEEGAAFATSLDLSVTRVLAKFRDYWHAKGGDGARKIDWDMTWRNWCRSDAERHGSQAPTSLFDRPKMTAAQQASMDNLAFVKRMRGDAPDEAPPSYDFDHQENYR